MHIILLNHYLKNGGKEDGEDSMTSVLEKLYKAQDELEEEIEKLKESVKAHEQELENLKTEAEDSDFEKLVNDFIEVSLTRLKTVIEENNLEISSEKIKSDLEILVRDFWNNEENKSRIVGMDNLANLHKDELFNAAMEEYFNNLEIASDETIEIAVLEKLKEAIIILGNNLTTKECFELIVENAKNKHQETQKELENLQKAIDKLENGDVDLMGRTRTDAGNTGKIIYVAVWFVLIFEVIILLILYYKRLFMLMILIAIFPLVTVAYAYEKSKGSKSSIFKNWVQEYVSNVFIQTIHAILYVTLVESGYSIYKADDQAWLIYILAVVALITSEPIFKAILGVKGSTLSDLKKTSASALGAAAAFGAVAGTVIHTGKDFKNIDKAYKNKEAATNKKHEKNDKKRATLRQHRDNKINLDGSLTKEEKERKLNEKHEKDAKADKRKEWLRKQNAKKRVHQRRLRKAWQATKNISGAMGAVAGGLAAGGDVKDFVMAAGVANVLSGTGQKVDLSDDAKKEQEAMEKAASEGGGATSGEGETASPDLGNINYSGDSYDDYGYNGDGGFEDGVVGPTFTPAPTQMTQAFARKLEEEKVYIKKNINVTVEGDKN